MSLSKNRAEAVGFQEVNLDATTGSYSKDVSLTANYKSKAPRLLPNHLFLSFPVSSKSILHHIDSLQLWGLFPLSSYQRQANSTTPQHPTPSYNRMYYFRFHRCLNCRSGTIHRFMKCSPYKESNFTRCTTKYFREGKEVEECRYCTRWTRPTPQEIYLHHRPWNL